jgi:hypothetical protein
VGSTHAKSFPKSLNTYLGRQLGPAGSISYIPKETPDIGCGKVDAIASTELINLNLLGNGSVGKYDHLKTSASFSARAVNEAYLIWLNHLRCDLS